MTPAELRQRRKTLRYSQRELGAIVGRSKESLSRYERGTEPVPKFLAVVLAALKPKRKKYTRRAKRRQRG